MTASHWTATLRRLDSVVIDLEQTMPALGHRRDFRHAGWDAWMARGMVS